MKVLVLGGSGYIGSRLCRRLGDISGIQFSRASRRGRVDTRDLPAMTAALKGMDCVVNCVAGDFKSIADGAAVLVRAALESGCERIVHLSSMAVYGHAEGVVDERHALDPTLGWYARAKCEAESVLDGYARQGGNLVVLRPGCVWGAGSELWVGRIGRWLRQRRLGDLGVGGDGWTNLVHVDDVCAAILQALDVPIRNTEPLRINLSAPDSPRWNTYFTDLALAIGAVPVRRLGMKRLRLDAMALGPPLKIAERLLRALRIQANVCGDAITPGLLGLWRQQILVDGSRASSELGVQWTSYDSALAEAAHWICSGMLRAPRS